MQGAFMSKKKLLLTLSLGMVSYGMHGASNQAASAAAVAANGSTLSSSQAVGLSKEGAAVMVLRESEDAASKLSEGIKIANSKEKANVLKKINGNHSFAIFRYRFFDGNRFQAVVVTKVPSSNLDEHRHKFESLAAIHGQNFSPAIRFDTTLRSLQNPQPNNSTMEKDFKKKREKVFSQLCPIKKYEVVIVDKDFNMLSTYDLSDVFNKSYCSVKS